MHANHDVLTVAAPDSRADCKFQTVACFVSESASRTPAAFV